ncbi:hypothetical protein ABT120_16235 [Nonomuraea angiospora]|uniref:DUF7134 domain-containing protein n=1 Tax=Nonomuraea angiospora TaxID=46172 RepID=UPI00332E933C
MRQRTFLAARIDQWSREHPRRLDLALTGLMWLVSGLPSALAGLPAFLVATAAILPLVVRRRFPAAVLLWSAAVFGVQLMVVPIPLPADIAQAVVVYTVAAHVVSLPIRLLALGAALAGSVLAGLRWSTPPEGRRAIGTCATRRRSSREVGRGRHPPGSRNDGPVTAVFQTSLVSGTSRDAAITAESSRRSTSPA